MVSKRLLLSAIAVVLPMLVTTQANALVTDAVASYYGARFHGRLTASGERFDMHDLTAAHRTLKFGTRVMVTNTANGRSVEVTINDRGPYVKGRAIDLSKGAAQALGMLGSGIAHVTLTVIGNGEPQSAKPGDLTVAQAERMMIDLF